MPCVSVIIPAFNAAAFLEAAISSVAVQSFRDFEVIIVDDHSTDGTKDLAQHLLARYNLKGQVLTRPATFRKGAGGARNAGAAAAKGRILAFLDSDDSWAVEHLERAVVAMAGGHSGIVAYCAAAQAYNPMTGKSYMIPHEGYPCRGVCDLRKVLLSGMIIPNVTLCVDARAFRQVGGYAEDLACYEDWWLVLHLAGLGKFFVDHAIGCKVLIRENSLSNTLNSRGTPAMSSAMFRDAMRFVHRNYKQGGLAHDEMRQLENSVAHFIASQLFAAMRSRMPAELLTIIRAILGNSRYQPRLTMQIIVKTLSLCSALLWSKVCGAKIPTRN